MNRSLVAALAASFVLAAAPAVACNCANTPLGEALDAADAVFVGKVVKLEVIETRSGTDTIRATVETGGIAEGARARRGPFDQHLLAQPARARRPGGPRRAALGLSAGPRKD